MVDVNEMPPLMSVQQTSCVLNMPERTVSQMCKKGHIYAVKIGRQWRVNRDDLYRQYHIRSRFVKVPSMPIPAMAVPSRGAALQVAMA